MSSQLDIMLENEMMNNKLEAWNKLNKSCKLLKLRQYADMYGQTEKYTDEQISELYLFLVTSMSRGKLTKVKDVVYNKTNNTITSIPGLQYVINKDDSYFVINDKNKISTLLSMTPKRTVNKTTVVTK